MKGIDVVMSILDRIRQRNEEGESNSGMKKRQQNTARSLMYFILYIIK